METRQNQKNIWVKIYSKAKCYENDGYINLSDLNDFEKVAQHLNEQLKKDNLKISYSYEHVSETSTRDHLADATYYVLLNHDDTLYEAKRGKNKIRADEIVLILAANKNLQHEIIFCRREPTPIELKLNQLALYYDEEKNFCLSFVLLFKDDHCATPYLVTKKFKSISEFCRYPDFYYPELFKNQNLKGDDLYFPFDNQKEFQKNVGRFIEEGLDHFNKCSWVKIFNKCGDFGYLKLLSHRSDYEIDAAWSIIAIACKEEGLGLEGKCRKKFPLVFLNTVETEELNKAKKLLTTLLKISPTNTENYIQTTTEITAALNNIPFYLSLPTTHIDSHFYYCIDMLTANFIQSFTSQEILSSEEIEKIKQIISATKNLFYKLNNPFIDKKLEQLDAVLGRVLVKYENTLEINTDFLHHWLTLKTYFNQDAHSLINDVCDYMKFKPDFVNPVSLYFNSLINTPNNFTITLWEECQNQITELQTEITESKDPNLIDVYKLLDMSHTLPEIKKIFSQPYSFYELAKELNDCLSKHEKRMEGLNTIFEGGPFNELCMSLRAVLTDLSLLENNAVEMLGYARKRANPTYSKNLDEDEDANFYIQLITLIILQPITPTYEEQCYAYLSAVISNMPTEKIGIELHDAIKNVLTKKYQHKETQNNDQHNLSRVITELCKLNEEFSPQLQARKEFINKMHEISLQANSFFENKDLFNLLKLYMLNFIDTPCPQHIAINLAELIRSFDLVFKDSSLSPIYPLKNTTKVNVSTAHFILMLIETIPEGDFKTNIRKECMKKMGFMFSHDVETLTTIIQFVARAKFQCAAVAGDTKTLKEILDSQSEISFNLDADNYALKEAVSNGHLEVVKILLTETSLDSYPSFDRLIKTAAEKNHVEIMKYLMQKHSLNHNYYKDIIINAASLGRLKVVKHLIEQGFPFDGENDEALCFYEFLDAALKSGYIKVIKYLYNKISNPNEFLFDNDYYGNINFFEILLADIRVNPTIRSNKLLVHACQQGDTKIVKLLLAHPAVSAEVNRDREYFIKSVMYRNREELIEILSGKSKFTSSTNTISTTTTPTTTTPTTTTTTTTTTPVVSNVSASFFNIQFSLSSAPC